jgi:hypothetical protein
MKYSKNAWKSEQISALLSSGGMVIDNKLCDFYGQSIHYLTQDEIDAIPANKKQSSIDIKARIKKLIGYNAELCGGPSGPSERAPD